MEVAICFYSPGEWEKLKKIAADKKKLGDTYTDWLTGFNNAILTLKSQGIHPTPLNVEIDELEQWCKQHKLKNNGENRSKYAAEMAMKLSKNS